MLLPLEIDRACPDSLTAQVQSAIRGRVRDGGLRPGARLPSSRNLAADLGVSRSVVVQAYEQLTAEGFLRAERGSGTRVASHLPAAPGPEPVVAARDPGFDLRVDATGPELFPARDWLSAYERAVRTLDGGLAKAPDLAAELAEHLGRARGVRAPGLTVTTGAAQALAVLCGALVATGTTAIAVENPGDQRHARVAAAAGLRVLPVPVDRDGIDVQALVRSGVRAVLVTPVAQMPTGACLSPERRAALLDWAGSTGAHVIEHDPDGHLWLGAGGGPLALQRELPEQVAYVGTARALLGPVLRLGWYAAPPALGRHTGPRAEPDTLTQVAFADFLGRGQFDQHVRQVRARYRARRAALLRAVAEHLPGVRVLGGEAGAHAWLSLRPGDDDVALAAHAKSRSVALHTARQFHIAPSRSGPALVLGYGAVRRRRLVEAVSLLAPAHAQGGHTRADRKFASIAEPMSVVMLSG
ncbi:PLP-dependent aminotransferase family protein [Actinokineospora sp. G85]|uniref:aminotransferase-like domain-containing protein n=1 Tax=Actinokineospora sp. G85 TaxID=3406626 RepID=UPI003C73E48D